MHTLKIFVTFQFEGFHQYKDAPDEVAFLKDLHRHIFHFRVETYVTHEDRELEFILFKRECKAILQHEYGEEPMVFKNASCETIGLKLISELTKRYGARNYTVTVSEDGENGAVISNDEPLPRSTPS